MSRCSKPGTPEGAALYCPVLGLPRFLKPIAPSLRNRCETGGQTVPVEVGDPNLGVNQLAVNSLQSDIGQRFGSAFLAWKFLKSPARCRAWKGLPMGENMTRQRPGRLQAG